MQAMHWGVFASVLFVTACGSPSPRAELWDLKVTNGRIVEESDYPQVVNLYRRVYANGQLQGGSTCTGTWIGPNTILTAAHCTGDGPSDADGLVQNIESMVFAITDHTSIPKKTQLITPVLSAYRNPRAMMSLSKVQAAAGDAVEILGFGFYDMSTFGKKGDDHLRIGRNRLASVKDGFLNIRGEIKDQANGATGESASAGSGDSGGPILRAGQQIGVASGGGSSGIFNQGEASYVDLNSPESRAFLARFGY
ncbi:MAG: trypsin-like serine protease [Proteobacteria bacterium]|nr:trypsin-like serine protease [Pseudomonadota bacterium]